MFRGIKAIHGILTVTAWGIIVFSLIRTAVIWKSLPDEIGIHFGSNGEFDVVDSKNYIVYPYLISMIVLMFCEIAAWISRKINIGIKVNQEGDIKLRTAFTIVLDISKLGLSFFFSGVWVDCVIRQHPLDTDIPVFILLIAFLSFIIFVITAIAIKIKHSQN